MISSTNFFRRYWNGEIPLVKSFWLIGMLGRISLILLELILLDVLSEGSYLIAALFSVVFSIWMYTGLWRSAARRGGFWGGLVKVMIIIGILSTIADFGKSFDAVDKAKQVSEVVPE